jgi:CubicO group peptidase (beta-lactamase class C family)
MTTRRKGLTRRAALAGLAGIGGLAATPPELMAQGQPGQPPPRAPEPYPITGKAGPGLEPLDQAMLNIMSRHGLPGAAFAMARDGKLILAKGYGWSNVATGTPADPETLFGLASLSKPLTAVGTLKLVEQGKLGLDDRVFDLLNDIKPPPGAQGDPRLKTITVRQCLNHSGGWDRGVAGDPINWEPQICRAYRVPPPLSAVQFLSFMLTQGLDFDPGTQQKYSNIGFVILGEVISRVSGLPYDRYLSDQVLKPMGIKRAGLHGFDGKYIIGEAVRCLAGTLVPLPPMLLPMINAAGGWTASVVDMVRFLTNLDGSRGEPVLGEKMRKAMLEPPTDPLKRRDSGTWFGLGWDAVIIKDKAMAYYKEGSYQGMRTFMKRLPSGINWALLFNASMEFDPQDTQVAANVVREVHDLIDANTKYPDIDLFKDYP